MNTDGSQDLVEEVWGGKPCDENDSLWFVAEDRQGDWYPMGEASWDSSRGLYVQRIPAGRIVDPASVEVHLVFADGSVSRALQAWINKGDATTGLDELPEGAKDQGT
jgi:hypothetical protein